MAGTVHLIIESGPERGRSIHVPLTGVRMGRASNNDVVIDDASLSRFHCRFYFKDHRRLHVADLASTNETLVNDKPVKDAELAVGDRVHIGETVLKVVATTPEGIPASEAEAPALGLASAPSPAAEPSSAAPPAEPPPTIRPEGTASHEIDLGLHPRPAVQVRRAEHRRRRPGVRLLVALVVVLAVAIAAAWLLSARRPMPTGPVRSAAATPSVEIDYEKVQASSSNIFRYRLVLRDGMLSIRIDNLEDGRQLAREKRLSDASLRELADRLRSTDFFLLEPEYMGVAPDVWEAMDLSVVLDRRAHRVRVANRIEPAAFRDTRMLIEEFGQNELGMYAIALPRERLLELAREAWLQGRKLFDEREVRPDNLARAIQRFTEVETLLEVVEPKPEIYADAIRAREECVRALQERYESLMFRADRAIRLSEWRDAERELLAILDAIPSRDDERHQTAYKKLLYVQSKIRRR